MDIPLTAQQIFDFLTSGNAERVAGMVFAFLAVLTIVAFFTYYFVRLIFDLIKRFFDLFKIKINRPEKIIKVPEYITPPVNKEMDEYVKILKKIAKDYKNDNNNELLP